MSQPRKDVFIAIVLSIVLLNAFAPPTAYCLDQSARDALIASLPRGDAFENNGLTYVWLPTLRGERTAAVDAVSSSAQASAASAAARPVVEQKGFFTIYKTTSAPNKLFLSSAGASSYPVALNEQTRSLAVITGNIWLKLKNLADAEVIAGEYGLTLSFSNKPMTTAFYRMAAGTDVQQMRKRLQTDSRIIRVTLDMVDRIRRPR